MRALTRAAALHREFATADRIPYTAHVAPTVVRTAFGDYLQVFRLGGASFESSDDEELNNWHERLNVLWRNVAESERGALDAGDSPPRRHSSALGREPRRSHNRLVLFAGALSRKVSEPSRQRNLDGQ